MTKGNKDEAAALVAVLQSPSEASEARCSACEAVLNLSKSDVTCAVLCSVGGIHAVVNAVKGTGESSAFLKAAAATLSNLYRFDQKLVSVVVRLQGGIGALLEALREYIHCGDMEFLQVLLVAISDVSNNAANAQQLVKEGGTAVVLASVLAHLKSEALLQPSLQILVNITRAPGHVPLLVREGGVPAVLAAILAHLRSVEVLRAALTVLRNIVTDDGSALRLGGLGSTGQG
tara:strand:- start:358 stop:1053 length:696 start_codon:yes stop_codon:yes gene_type:complete